MIFTAEKKKRTKSGKFWEYWATLRYESWCVMKNGKFFCEAKSESAAKEISSIMNSHYTMVGLQ